MNRIRSLGEGRSRPNDAILALWGVGVLKRKGAVGRVEEVVSWLAYAGVDEGINSVGIAIAFENLPYGFEQNEQVQCQRPLA
jgi:hypothetical protein